MQRLGFTILSLLISSGFFRLSMAEEVTWIPMGYHECGIITIEESIKSGGSAEVSDLISAGGLESFVLVFSAEKELLHYSVISGSVPVIYLRLTVSEAINNMETIMSRTLIPAADIAAHCIRNYLIAQGRY